MKGRGSRFVQPCWIKCYCAKVLIRTESSFDVFVVWAGFRVWFCRAVKHRVFKVPVGRRDFRSTRIRTQSCVLNLIYKLNLKLKGFFKTPTDSLNVGSSSDTRSLNSLMCRNKSGLDGKVWTWDKRKKNQQQGTNQSERETSLYSICSLTGNTIIFKRFSF